jgi:hypothetical protein
MKTEADPVSETLCYLNYQTKGKVGRPGSAGYYTPPSEAFRIYKQRSISEKELSFTYEHML